MVQDMVRIEPHAAAFAAIANGIHFLQPVVQAVNQSGIRGPSQYPVCFLAGDLASQALVNHIVGEPAEVEADLRGMPAIG
jgi:hypothetical protein